MPTTASFAGGGGVSGEEGAVVPGGRYNWAMAAEPAKSTGRAALEAEIERDEDGKIIPRVTARDRRMVALWKEAAEDDWRSPVRIEEGWQEQEMAALADSIRERPLPSRDRRGRSEAER